MGSANPPSDPAADPNGLHLGEKPGAAGEVVLTSGTLSADPQLVGVAGSGTVTQTGGKNVTVCGSLVSSQLQRTFWPTDTVALAGVNCSTAIWVWSGSLMPARIVMGSAVTTPDDFDFEPAARFGGSRTCPSGQY